MRVTEEKQVTEKVVKDYLCNLCGESCKDKHGINFEGLLGAAIDFGYGSSCFGDGTMIELSLCESCLFELSKTCKVKMRIWEEEFNDFK